MPTVSEAQFGHSTISVPSSHGGLPRLPLSKLTFSFPTRTVLHVNADDAKPNLGRQQRLLSMNLDGGTDGSASLILDASCGATFSTSRVPPRTPAKLQRKRSQPHKGVVAPSPKRSGLWLSYQSENSSKDKKSEDKGKGKEEAKPEPAGNEKGNTIAQPAPLTLRDAGRVSSMAVEPARSHASPQPQTSPQSQPSQQAQANRRVSRDSGVGVARRPTLPTHQEEKDQGEAGHISCHRCASNNSREVIRLDSDGGSQQSLQQNSATDPIGYDSDSALHQPPPQPRQSEGTGYDSDTTIRQSSYRKRRPSGDLHRPNSNDSKHIEFSQKLPQAQRDSPLYRHSISHFPGLSSGETSAESNAFILTASPPVQIRLGDTLCEDVHDVPTPPSRPRANTDSRPPKPPFHQSWVEGGPPKTIGVHPGANLPTDLLRPGSPSPSSQSAIQVVSEGGRPPEVSSQPETNIAAPTPLPIKYTGPVLQMKTPPLTRAPSSQAGDVTSRLRKEEPVELILSAPPPPPTPVRTPGVLPSLPPLSIPSTPSRISHTPRELLRPLPLRISPNESGITEEAEPESARNQGSLPAFPMTDHRQRQMLNAELGALPVATYPWLSLSLVRQVRQTFKIEFATFQKQVDERLSHIEKQLEEQQLWFAKFVGTINGENENENGEETGGEEIGPDRM